MVQKVSRLVMASVVPATLSRCTKEYVAFFEWADGSVRVMSSWSDIDGLLVDYLDGLFELNQGRGRSAAGNLVEDFGGAAGGGTGHCVQKRCSFACRFQTRSAYSVRQS